MGFFEQQDRARRATARLVLLYALAVAFIVACANAIGAAAHFLWTGAAPGFGLYAGVSAGVLAAIALGSLEIVARLSLGEGELAQLLAGRRIGRGSGIDRERRLVNVVDEMAIAAGVAAPPVYVLARERGINAFAAGRSPNQAVIVVTGGALERLSRDELQAVVAHEFSHILNGDILLNLRAACVLQGIVFLSGIGRFMMRYYSWVGTEEGRRFFHLPFAALGAVLFALGWVGLLCARLIQAAISREREYLADACAVQYTRNADALCGALAAIARHREGSRLLDWHADSLAHMLFAENARSWMSGLFATHPPLAERMQRANPHVPPRYYFERKPVEEAPKAPVKAYGSEPPKTIVPKRATAVAALVASIGEPGEGSLEYAAGLLAYLPASLREALGSAQGSQALMLACLLDADLDLRTLQLAALEKLGLPELARQAEVLAPLVRALDRAYRLPLAGLALPVLRKDLDLPGRARFLHAIRVALEADRKALMPEFVLLTLLEWNLAPQTAAPGGQAEGDRALVLSLLERADGEVADIDAVRAALARLRALPPLGKEPLIAAFAAAVEADGNVRLPEYELLRAVCAAMDCPMPQAIAALDPRLLRK